MSDHTERLARNDESRNRATHHREEWDGDEIALLLTWDQTAEELVVMAELLGRTIEACRQRFYQTLRGEVTSVTVKKTVCTTTEVTVSIQPEDRGRAARGPSWLRSVATSPP